MKSFLTACGLADSLQLVIENQSEAEGELRLFHQPFVIIGRDTRADMILDHVNVSRRHAYLQVIDGHAFWVDLESRTGIRSGGEFQKSGWLDSGHQIAIGPFVIRRYAGDRSLGGLGLGSQPLRPAPLTAGALNNSPLPEVALEFLNGPSHSTEWPVRRVMSLLGSGNGCKFRLTDASVSRFHASLLRTSSGLWIVDLLGQGGITVNDVPVRFSHLDDGAQLQIGRYQIRVRYRNGRQHRNGEFHDKTRLKAAGPHLSEEQNRDIPNFPGHLAVTPLKIRAIESAPTGVFPLALPAPSAVADVVIPSLFSIQTVPGELSESILVPLVNQFGLMQQQMFDQFQQAMSMMVQMFGTMHRDQMAVIREELDRLRELTDEFHALKKDLADRTRAEIAPINLAESMVATGNARSAPAPDLSQLPDQIAALIPAARQVASVSSLASSEQLASSIRTTTASQPHVVPARRSGEKTNRESQPTESKQFESTPPTPTETQDTPTQAGTERDSVAWLHQRIMTLQRERETRWQRILKLLPGNS
jgi:pSer/pThr/pTyr-binding forkhead associated (FHA) protein